MFKGSIVAIVTPMDEKGNICRKSLKKLIDYHVASGTSAIVSAGTTGETSTLSRKERSDLIMLTLELAEGRIPIIAGTGSNSTTEAIRLTQRLNDSGVVGCLTVTPYYNCPTQEGLFQHFKAIAQHTDLPQILYNIPSRTGCDILPETINRLATIKNIVGIKEATGSLIRVRKIKELVSDNFILLSGNDPSALNFMQLGGHGVISVTANVAARDMSEMCKLIATGNFDDARVINQRLMPLHNRLFVESNPIPVKWACKELGLLKSDTLRLPMTSITDHNRKLVSSALKYAGLLDI